MQSPRLASLKFSFALILAGTTGSLWC